MPAPRMVDERAAAYRVWAMDTGQNVQETARRLGLNPDTVGRWSREEHWRERWANSLNPELMAHLGHLKMSLSASMPEVVETLKHEMRTADTSSGRIRAANGLAALYQTLVVATLEPGDAAVIEAQYATLDSDGEPAGYLEANVMDAERGHKAKSYRHKR